MERMKEEREEMKHKLNAAYNLLEEYGVPIPGRTVQGHDARTFKWKVSKIQDKLDDYVEGRPVLSPEFTLWGMKGLQLEWYPHGVDKSFEGWSSMKLRIPMLPHGCKVSVKWRIIFGPNLWVGPRQDEFCEQFWWCKRGLINWTNFVKTDLLRQQINSKGMISMTIDIIKATITPVDKNGVAIHTMLPKKLSPLFQAQSAAELHAIAAAGGSNSIAAKQDKDDVDVQILVNQREMSDQGLLGLVRRYLRGIPDHSKVFEGRDIINPIESNHGVINYGDFQYSVDDGQESECISPMSRTSGGGFLGKSPSSHSPSRVGTAATSPSRRNLNYRGPFPGSETRAATALPGIRGSSGGSPSLMKPGSAGSPLLYAGSPSHFTSNASLSDGFGRRGEVTQLNDKKESTLITERSRFTDPLSAESSTVFGGSPNSRNSFLRSKLGSRG